MEWYILARDVARRRGTEAFVVHDKGSEALVIEPRKRAEFFFQSKPIVSSTEKAVSNVTTRSMITGLATTTSQTFSDTQGLKMAGWMVRLKVGGEVVLVKGSSTLFEEMGRTGKGL